MDCNTFRSGLFSWYENPENDATAGEFEEHARQCSDCAGIWEEFSATMRIIEQEKLLSPHPFAETRMLALIEKQQEVSVPWFFPAFPALVRLSLAAGLVLVAIMAGNWLAGLEQRKLNSHQSTELVRNELNIPEWMNESNLVINNP